MEKHQTIARRRTLGFSMSLMLLILPLTLGTIDATATTVFSEDWESGGSGWAMSSVGIGIDCTVAYSGSCSLKMSAPCGGACGSYSIATTPIAASLSGKTIFSMAYRSDSTGGDTDSYFNADLDNGARIFFTPNWGINNCASIHVLGVSSHNNFMCWGSANTWYSIEIEFDRSTNTVRATMGGQSSNAISVPPGASILSSIEFNSVSWSSLTTTHWYDALFVTTEPSAPTAPQALTAKAGGRGEIVLNWQAPSYNGGSPVTDYHIYVATFSGGSWSYLDNTGGALSYTHSDLPDNTRRYYYVEAENAAGWSSPSNVADARTSPGPSDSWGIPPTDKPKFYVVIP